MKKWIALIVCFLICASCIIFYPQTGREERAPEEKHTVLKWMVYGAGYQDTEIVMDAFNEKLHEVYPDISLEIVICSPREYGHVWDEKMAKNEAIDLAWIGSESVNFVEESKKGNLMALDYLLQTEGEALLKSIPAEFWAKQKKDGNTYGVPVEGPLYRRNLVLTVNRSLMSRYGDFDTIIEINQSAPYTTAECFACMEPFLENLKENNALGKGISYQTVCALADKGYEGLYGESSPFVIRVFDEKPTVYNKYEQESYRACFETMCRWYEDGYIREDVAYLLDPTSEDGKKAGNILYVEEYGDKSSVYGVRQAEYDVVRGEMDGYRYISFETCRNVLVIPRTSKHPKEAMQLLNFLHTEEGKPLYRMLAYGIEKQQYVVLHKDEPVIARMKGDATNFLYSLDPVNFGNLFQGYEYEGGEFETIRKNNEEAMQSPLTGFELDTRMIAVDMARTDLVVEKYKERLCQGISEDWEAEYAAFLQEMKQAGSDRIVDEMQRQVDAFLDGRE